MPSGAKRRRAAKKKQLKESNNSNSSSTTHSHHGESDGGELISPAAQDQLNHQAPFTDQEIEKKNETSLYQNESITVQTTEKAVNTEEGNPELNEGSKLSKSDNSSSSSICSSVDDESRVFPEKIAHEVKDSGVETFSVLDQIKPAESDVKDGTQIEKLVPKSSFSEQMVVVNGNALKDNCSTSSEVAESVMVENGSAKLASLEENASLEARDDDKQPLVASAPRAVETTSWKGCCGILELFSRSDRN